ncbi:HAMP domain-containing protein [Streptomyces sp. NPDC091280]|uniref:HAMP domain-containing protein n=1 Tax=Streptomyces sp. NPDC091280 TaxID=3365984 RepID=UPI00380CE528
MEAGSLGLRLPDTDQRAETGRLGAALNDMLDRLQQALPPEGFPEVGCGGSWRTPGMSCGRRAPPSRASPSSAYANRTVQPNSAWRPTNKSPAATSR